MSFGIFNYKQPLGLEIMVSPKTRGIRGRGTRLKREAVKKGGGGLLAIICALFSIGLTLEGLSISSIFTQSLNLLSLIGLVGGSLAIGAALGLWIRGRKLQKYRKPKQKITTKWKMRSKKRSRKKSKSKKMKKK